MNKEKYIKIEDYSKKAMVILILFVTLPCSLLIYSLTESYISIIIFCFLVLLLLIYLSQPKLKFNDEMIRTIKNEYTYDEITMVEFSREHISRKGIGKVIYEDIIIYIDDEIIVSISDEWTNYEIFKNMLVKKIPSKLKNSDI